MTVVIPSKNCVNLWLCVSAIRRNNPGVRILVIDDGLEGMDRPLPQCFIMSGGGKPFNYSRNCNIGILASYPDDVILMNDDAVLGSPGGFGTLQAASERFGIVAASTNRTGNTAQIRLGLDGVREATMVAFICVYIKRQVIDVIGLLDEDYTDYGREDDDFCLRARQAGFRIGVCDGCFVDHAVLPSSFRFHRSVSFKHNDEVFLRKHGMTVEEFQGGKI